MGYEGNKNSPWYSLFDDSILTHRVTISVGKNFKSKNLVVVLHFHKIQVWHNVSRIWTPKIRERDFCRKHRVFKKEKKRVMQQPLGYMNLDCSRRPGMGSR